MCGTTTAPVTDAGPREVIYRWQGWAPLIGQLLSDDLLYNVGR